MYKNLVVALVLAVAGCAHAPVTVAPAPVEVAPPPPAAAPCVLVEPPNLLQHPLIMMAEPEQVKEVSASGQEVPVMRFRITSSSVADFFVAARVLNDWAQETWKSCGGGAR